MAKFKNFSEPGRTTSILFGEDSISKPHLKASKKYGAHVKALSKKYSALVLPLLQKTSEQLIQLQKSGELGKKEKWKAGGEGADRSRPHARTYGLHYKKGRTSLEYRVPIKKVKHKCWGEKNTTDFVVVVLFAEFPSGKFSLCLEYHKEYTSTTYVDGFLQSPSNYDDAYEVKVEKIKDGTCGKLVEAYHSELFSEKPVAGKFEGDISSDLKKIFKRELS